MNEGTIQTGMDADATPPRLRRADRKQVRMMTCSLDELLPADHFARVVWDVVNVLDVSAFEAPIAARGSDPGRASTDPRILISLWLYATIKGIGSGREVDRLCELHDAYRWICGGVSLNYHTINDFRVHHDAALDQLLSKVIAILVQQGEVDVQQISQDGLRVRASAGSSSFRGEASLEDLKAQAQQHIEELKKQNDPAISAQQQAKREADARDRAARLEKALREELPKLQETKAKAGNRKRQPGEARVSTTDPEARVMKMPDGGYRPAYNVQLAVDVKSRAIVGVDVVNDGRDSAHSTPMREQVEQRTGKTPEAHLFDGGYVNLDAIDQAEADGVKIYAPVKKSNANEPGARKHRHAKTKGKGKVDPFARKPSDTDHTFTWRQRMAGDGAKTIYKQRAATVETVNADLTEHRGLRRLPVRGSPRVRAVVLWFVLAYNLKRFAATLIAALDQNA